MAYTIKIGAFAKNIESTAQPDTSGWASYDVTLKNGADISDPQITLNAAWSEIQNYNYVEMLGRYYWITDRNMLRENLCVLRLHVDVLATFKQEIGNSSLYVLRSASESDGTIVDNYYPTKASVTYSEELQSPYYSATPYTSGFYVVNISGIAGGTGTSTLWQMTPSQFRSFISGVYTSIDGFQPADIFEAINKLLSGSPTKLISSAMWFPGGISFTSSTAQRVYVGSWDSGVDAKLITDPIYVDSSMWLDIHRHPQAAARGEFLNLAPYSIYTLALPLFGSINLDPTLMLGGTQVHVYLRVDAVSGVATVEIDTGGDRPLLGYLTAQMGVAMPLNGQESGSSVAGGIVSTLAGVAAAIATGGAAAPIIGATSAGIGTAVSAMSGASFSSGSVGSILAPTATWRLNSTHFTIADEDNTRNGRPLMKVRKINVLSGFIMVQKGDVEIAGTLSEHQEVKRYLETGFFYE